MRTPMQLCCRVLLITALTLFCLASDRSSAFAATTITVINTGSSGPGSLDQAIIDGNTSSPPVTINFSIPPFDGTVKTIAPQTVLSTITNTIAINGFSQSGASPGLFPDTLTNNPVLLIALDGNIVGGGVIATGLIFTVSGSLQGLIIQNFNGAGVSVADGVTLSENVISNNFVGIECNGNTNSFTGNVFVLDIAAIQMFGSSNTFAVNVVSNTDGTAVSVSGGNNSLVGNLISSNSADGVDLLAGTNDVVSNIISSNIGSGVLIQGDNNSFSNNIISANGVDGVGVVGFSNNFANCTISANFGVGANIGAFDFGSSGNNTLSGDTLSANGAGGVVLNGGTNRLLASTISSNTGDGVLLSGTGNVVGGPASGSGNTIIQNTSSGVDIASKSIEQVVTLAPIGNVVQGNFVGTDATGTNNLGNGQSGVLIDGTTQGASDNLVGGGLSGAANIIAFNGSNGVTITQSGTFTAIQNGIFRNAIYSNVVLGIDLGADGVTPNHAFGVFPSGPNNLQNFPVLTSAVCSNGGVLIQGSITNSTSSSSAHLEFFANITCDPSGFGQGQSFIGSADVTTDLSGGATFALPFSTNLVGEFVTATASDSSSNTSEFSQCIPVVDQPPTITVCPDSITVSADTNCEAVVTNFTNAVQATDNCSSFSDLVITQSPTNGTIVTTLGTNTVTITVMNQAGLSTNCTTSFIVADTTPPVITCPSDITNTVEFPTPTATASCSATATVTCVPASGSIFPLGTTPVVCTAVDEAGNTASCTFNVVITGPQQVIVDIFPGFCPNILYTKGGGVLQVAIVGTESLDVRTIIPASVTLNGVLANANPVIEDVAVPFVYTRHCPKKKKDGIPDLVVEFDVDQLVASLGTVKNGEVKVLTVNGAFLDRSTFEGQDKIKISTKKCKLPKGLKNPF